MMRTLIVLLVFAMIGLIGCSEHTDTSVDGFNGYVRIWTDPATGCEYIVTAYSYGGGVTPRLKADGTQVCGVRS